MHLSKIKTIAAVIAVSAYTAFAQFESGAPANARVYSLAGVPVSDISGVYSYPVLMTGYLDHVQVTWGGGFIGVKSVSDMFSIGVLANQGPMAPALAAAAVGRLQTYTTVPPQSMPPGLQGGPIAFDANALAMPHVILGFDLGFITVGADIFFEYAGYSASYEDAAGASTDYSGSYANPGARLSAKLGIADVDLLAKFGIGFPSVSASAAANQSSLSSDAGLYMEMGAEAGMPIGNTDWVLGLNYTRADYRFQLGNAVDANANCDSRLNAYIGMEFNFVETAVGALSYSFDRFASTSTQPDISGSPSTSYPINHQHALSAAVENAWEKAWIFDSFQLRGGAQYLISVANNFRTSNPGIGYTAISRPATHQRLQPILGLGATKAFFTLDIALNPGNWGGVFTGPDVAMATATVKF